ncbi:glycosyl transferase family 90-domain-containing protein [Mycena galopus ATCC 62051]|nr:glycosyl transferase family 90-domain-containing protein [Mycena galopus ATCC 62051]
MSPPFYPILRRRSLRRPALILLVLFVLVFLSRFLRELGFDAQHSTSIAFKYAAGRAASTITHTVWATRTLTRDPLPTPFKNRVKKQKGKQPEPALGTHIYLPTGLLAVNPSGAHPIPELIARAEAAWAAKLARATTSLRAAAAEYTRRYARLPPKGFDVWWAYAAVNSVPLPDEYDQIDRDLGPFYGAHPEDLQGAQRAWEAHADSYTIGKNATEGELAMLNFTLPADEKVRLVLASGGFELMEMMDEVAHELPPFRAVFSPHDAPSIFMDHELRQQALQAAKKGAYIDPLHPPPEKHGWRAACPPLSPAWLDADKWPSVPPCRRPKTFVHDAVRVMDPCTHPRLFRTHGAYLAHGSGPGPHRFLVPQFSYSVTPLHADIRVAVPLNWVPDDFPSEGRPPPIGFTWAERVDARLQWRGSNTGIWHAKNGRWRESHRTRLAALAAGAGSVNVSVLDPGAGAELVTRTPVGLPHSVPRARLIPSLLDIAFAGPPGSCAESQCKVLEGMFEWRKAHDLKTAGRYKYILDVDGHGWSSRFKRLMNSGSLIFKATTYPEWFTDRLAPWVHYIPVQNSYSDLLDALLFFRAHDKAAQRIAAAGREWSRRYWRQEDLVAYMYRLFLEYARVMSTDRDAMSFEIWEDEREDAARERALMARWESKGDEGEE